MTDPATLPQGGFERLVAVMACLRAASGGCAWDRQQTLATLRTYLVEEAYELLDAIDGLGPASRALPAELPVPVRAAADASDSGVAAEAVAQFREELGDVLLQIAFQARIAEEAGWFDAADVARGIADKMIRRHPHVFDSATRTFDSATGTPDPPASPNRALRPAEVLDRWEQIKRQEGRSALAGVPRNLPALLRAQRIGDKAARIGFDWPDAAPVLDKIAEEIGELREAMAAGGRTEIEHELGDVLFALTNLARHLGVDAEHALRTTLDRFTTRFGHVERTIEARHGREHKADLDELEILWQEAKAAERAAAMRAHASQPPGKPEDPSETTEPS